MSSVARQSLAAAASDRADIFAPLSPAAAPPQPKLGHEEEREEDEEIEEEDEVEEEEKGEKEEEGEEEKEEKEKNL